MQLSRLLILLAGLAITPVPAMAQGTEVDFGAQEHDASQEVEVTADKLSIDQEDGSAIFEGDVVIGQGEMRISAAKVRIEYETNEEGGNSGRIERLIATGGVTLVNGEETMQADTAEYTIGDATIQMIGSVVMTQGTSALSSDRAFVELETGKAVLEGRVRTILQAGGN